MLQSGGVVRGITNWGVFALPKPLRDTSQTSQHKSQKKKQQQAASTSPQRPSASSNAPAPILAGLGGSAAAPVPEEKLSKHHVAHYFVLRFDSSSRTQHVLKRSMTLDSRLLRYTMVRLGRTLDDLADVGGKAEEWSNVPGNEGKRWSEIRDGFQDI